MYKRESLRTFRDREPCPNCGCPGEHYDGHVCEDFALAEIARAARAFVSTTSIFRQNRVSRHAFERMAIGLLNLEAIRSGGDG
jgi:hypothetical protein